VQSALTAHSLPTNPANYPLVQIAPTPLKLALLDGTLSKGSGLLCRLSLVLWKRHPLVNDQRWPGERGYDVAIGRARQLLLGGTQGSVRAGATGEQAVVSEKSQA
jgi:hypothetical protein